MTWLDRNFFISNSLFSFNMASFLLTISSLFFTIWEQESVLAYMWIYILVIVFYGDLWSLTTLNLNLTDLL